jgi:predicted PurR-regulated permease PerM
MTFTNKKRWIRIGILVLILAVCIFLYSLRGVLWPFIFAFFIAYILDPWVEFLQSKRFPRIVAVLTVLVGVTLAVVLAIILLFPMVSKEAANTVAKFPQYVEVIRTKMAPWIQNWISNHPALAAEAEKYFNANIRPAIPRLISPVFAFLASMFSSFAGFIIAMLNLLLVPVLTFYILLDFLNLKQKAIELMPPRYQHKVIHYFNEVDEALSGYLRGQLSVAIALGVIYTIGLLILGVPLAIPVGLISGLGNMVPYLGFVLGIAASMLLSFLDNQDWHRLVWIVLLYTFAQVNEGTWLSPLLVGKRTGLHPVVIMLALVVGGTLFGFMGMLLAVPFVSVAVVFLRAAYESYLNSDWYHKERVAEIATEVEEP